ncbi:MAG: YkgJ family cysteine cluster protein [Bacteroidetes bacterium]|nr:YkgJ family cysteine cluster protein [Bacteroidota bacterium]
MENELIKKIYTDIDRFIGTQSNCCKKGCAYCCHQQIEVMNVEKEVINEFITSELSDQTKEIIKENLNVWLDYFDSNTPDNKTLDGNDVFKDFGSKAAKDGLKCPFLIDNLCSIYEMRPMTCRVHIVESEPEFCNKNKLRDSTPNSFHTRLKIVNFLRSKSELRIEPLPYTVKHLFLPDRQLKPIEKNGNRIDHYK